MAKVETKRFYQSKSFWFGALFIITAVANFFGFTEYQPSAEVSRATEILIGVLIIALRFKTDKKITL